MKLLRLAVAAAVLSTAVGACDASRVSAPDQPRHAQPQGPAGDQSAPPSSGTTTTTSTPPAPGDTTSKGQTIGSGGG